MDGLGLSCGVVCVMIRLAVFIEHQPVTDRRPNRQTQDQGIDLGRIASRGNKGALRIQDDVTIQGVLSPVHTSNNVEAALSNATSHTILPTLLRHCCRLWQQCCRFRQQCRTKFRPFDKVETN